MRKPTNGASASHQRLFGNCGSVSFQAGVCRARAVGPTESGGSFQDPPRTTGLPPESAPLTHSATVANMSWRPGATAVFAATGSGLAPAVAAVQASPALCPGLSGVL